MSERLIELQHMLQSNLDYRMDRPKAIRDEAHAKVEYRINQFKIHQDARIAEIRELIKEEEVACQERRR